ncbi:hypothetical protein KQI82_06740 [Oscillibacter sp. MSJ-2]|uniref:RNA-binding S4 domain-containing protein n=1 Tax=Dysosmobacter acutus TaxID=2841504 RepID=A0ABS6FAQ7_9FIRM|nr:YlmH/Sll1252 family protein [Dysosmobacter acutus]MBU5626617.1 hypothetical protein [Dysosmobacter acutus]
MDKKTILDRTARSGEERLLLARVLDKMEQAERRNVPAHTAFLSPKEQSAVREVLRLSGGRGVFSGGYKDAERKVLACLPDWMEEYGGEDLRFLRCLFRKEDKLTHRDFLGSLMGMGVARETVGDILVEESSCDLVVLDTVADFLVQSWSSAGTAALRVQEITAGELIVPEAKVQEIRDTVMTLRLDAVAASGFSMSRSKAAELIASGRVQLNWQECTKGDRAVKAGDVITARGFGKFEIAEVGGMSRKGRTAILLKRYV